MLIAVSAGERVPVNGRVEQGHSDIDSAIVTGESTPQPVSPDALVQAGTLNLSGL